nr:syntaxin-related protein KNOLLE [Tanacetum cinerariifolium]
MDVMVEAQGEKMDDIEHHVINAAHYVNDETKNLKTKKRLPKEYQEVHVCQGDLIAYYHPCDPYSITSVSKSCGCVLGRLHLCILIVKFFCCVEHDRGKVLETVVEIQDHYDAIRRSRRAY